MDRGTLVGYTVRGVTKSQDVISDFRFETGDIVLGSGGWLLMLFLGQNLEALC